MDSLKNSFAQHASSMQAPQMTIVQIWQLRPHKFLFASPRLWPEKNAQKGLPQLVATLSII
jgi:hypothetical protein